ncbi:MAG: L-threonylcarbamoyladenylate synthase [Bacteroidota bacterium]|nr:L-threonylcarbamoyladenylate synthase [Bacteroidota bacterium]
MKMQPGTDIQLAKTLLLQGELVAIPTETVYGLAANAFNGNAVAKIYSIKNRPQFNPLIIHTDKLEKLAEWGINLPEQALVLAKQFSPGPLTYVVKKSAFIPDIVTAGHDSVAVRIPNHPLTLRLLEQLEFPLAAPSANPSGFISPTTAQHVFEQLGSKIPYILDGGPCIVGLESTIISFVSERPALLRLGGLTVEDIESVLGSSLDKSLLINNDNPLSPGMLSRHYSPAKKMVIGNVADYLDNYSTDKIAVIHFSEPDVFLPETNQFILSPNADLNEAAQKLFAVMRQADKLDVEIIIADEFPGTGLGNAINDRLRRASVL